MFAPTSDRDRKPVGKERRRPAILERGDRHHDARRPSHLPRAWRACPVRTGFDPRANSHRIGRAVSRDGRGGRKPVITDEKLYRARALITGGLTVREAAARVRVGRTALYAALKTEAKGTAPASA